MELLRSESEQRSYCIPRHGVWKANSTSTSLRMVFDAFIDQQMLLNDAFVGPNLQNELFELPVRFRTYAAAMTRGFAVPSNLGASGTPIPSATPVAIPAGTSLMASYDITYELTTVTFGIKVALLGLEIDTALAMEEAAVFLVAAETVVRELYMKTLSVSASSVMRHANCMPVGGCAQGRVSN